MGLAHSPRIVTDGLVLSLDAGSPKNYNVGVSTNWVDKVGGNNGTLVNGTSHNDGPFVGAGYVEFDGTGDYLSIADSTDFDLGLSSEAFTMEAWVNASSLGTNGIIGRGGGSGSWNSTDGHQYILFYSGGTDLYFQWWNGTVVQSINSTGALTVNVWAHLAVVFDGTDVKMYKNGTLLATGSSATFTKPSASNITRIASTASGSLWNGDISNVRIVKGTALYTSAFTPPTKPLTATSNTTLLTCQGNTIADASSSAHTITANGDAVANLGSPASAFEFDGTDDHVTTGNTLTDADELFADTGRAWSVSSWFNVDVISGADKSVISRGGVQGGGNNFLVWVTSSDLKVKLRGGTTTDISTSIAASTWYNVAITWDGTTAKGYLNGQFITTIPVGTASIKTGAENPFCIGITGSDLDNDPFDGKISQTLSYNRELTASEVEQNYNALKGRYA